MVAFACVNTCYNDANERQTGQVRGGELASNAAALLFSHPGASPVVALAARPDGGALVSGHADGDLLILLFSVSVPAAGWPAGSLRRLAPGGGGVPAVLAWGAAIVAAGTDCKARSPSCSLLRASESP